MTGEGGERLDAVGRAIDAGLEATFVMLDRIDMPSERVIADVRAWGYSELADAYEEWIREGDS